MKKFLIGCGIVVLIVFVLCIAGTLYVGYKARSFFQAWESAFENVATLNDKYPFTPPEPEQEDPERFRIYFDIRKQTGDKFAEHPVAQAILNADAEQPPQPGMRHVVSFMASHVRDTIGFFGNELDRNQMSLNEYLFYTEASYSALIRGAARGDTTMDEAKDSLAEEIEMMNQFLIQSGGQELMINMRGLTADIEAHGITVSEESRAVVREHIDQLTANPVMFYLDLFMLQNAYQEGKGPAQWFDENRPRGQEPLQERSLID